MTIIRLRAEDLAWHEVDGSILCLDIAKSVYLNVNATGTTLWPLLLEGSSSDVLAQRLVEAYDISPARAAEDVETFLSGLRARDLLTTS